MDRKGSALIIVAIVILAVLIVGGLWYYEHHSINTSGVVSDQISTSTQSSNTPIGTQGWSSYTNSRENYSFQYPSTWVVTTTSYGAIEITSFSHAGEPSSVGDMKIIILSLASGAENQNFNCDTPDICFGSLGDLVKAQGYDNATSVTINNYEALQVTVQALNSVHFFIRAGNKAYDMEYSPINSTLVDTFYKILSSVRFN